MRNDEKLFRTAVTAIIMILIKVVLSLASHSIYAITLYQPSESDNIYSYMEGDFFNEEAR